MVQSGTMDQDKPADMTILVVRETSFEGAIELLCNIPYLSTVVPDQPLLRNNPPISQCSSEIG